MDGDRGRDPVGAGWLRASFDQRAGGGNAPVMGEASLEKPNDIRSGYRNAQDKQDVPTSVTFLISPSEKKNTRSHMFESTGGLKTSQHYK